MTARMDVVSDRLTGNHLGQLARYEGDDVIVLAKNGQPFVWPKAEAVVTPPPDRPLPAPSKAAKKARKTIRRMMRDPVKWRIAEHLHEALPEGTLSPVAAYTLASQIADDIVPIITRNLEDEGPTS